MQGNQPAMRSASMISNCLSTMSQFWYQACQRLTIRWDARYSIRRRETSLLNEGLFFVICRNCRFRPLIMFVVYMILRISDGYSKKVFKTSQLSSQLLTQEGYCFRQVSPKMRRFSSVVRWHRSRPSSSSISTSMTCWMTSWNISFMASMMSAVLVKCWL